MTSRAQRAEDTRRLILSAARSCFAEKGLAATTTRQIASRAGVTQPLIHHYFGTKESLFEAVLEAALTHYDLAQSPQWSLPPGDLRFFTKGLATLFGWIGEHVELLRLGAWARLEGWKGDAKFFLPIRDRAREKLLQGQQHGVVRPDLDLDIAILMIDALFKGFWERYEYYNAYPLGWHDLSRQMLQTSLEVLLRGLLVPDVIEEALDLCKEL